MSDFYYKYRGLFEEETQSANHVQRFFVANPNPGVPKRDFPASVSVPDPVAPMNYSYQLPPEPRSFSRPSPSPQPQSQPRLVPLRPEALNALLDYQQPAKPMPVLSRRLEEDYHSASDKMLRPKQALRNVYKNSLCKLSDFAEPSMYAAAAIPAYSGQTEANPMRRPMETPAPMPEPCSRSSQMRTHEKCSAQEPSSKPESEEYRAARTCREARKRREKAKKLLGV